MSNPLLDDRLTNWINGLRVKQVEVGTTVTDERTGQEMTVEESGAVVDQDKGIMYCTKRVYERLANEFPD